jgi:erythronate-4-phosphate dehydrogenase
MKIVADENIPLLSAFFSDMSRSLVTKAGRDLTAEDVKDADVLLVRSITQVNERLLDGSTVKFVGTCTIGTDHIDMEYLKQKGIAFSSAPGCNAQAVVDYVLSALLVLGEKWQKPWTSLSIGIVGAGNVGGRLYKTLKGLGVNVQAYDPNVAEFSSEELAQSVWQSDVVTLHTPITHGGPHKTHHLVDAKKLASMPKQSCLINSCRGLVVDNQALLDHLKVNSKFEAILDVWEQEPSPSDELIQSCLLSTPHIAGYSLDGKYRGTSMIYDALCEFMALPKRLKLPQLIAEPALRKVSVSPEATEMFVLQKLIRSAYDIRDDHFRMLSLLGLNDSEKAKGFDHLRKHYPMRRDLTCLTLSAKRFSGLAKLEALGIKIK